MKEYARCIAVLAAGATATWATPVHSQETAHALFRSARGDQIGTATLRQMPSGVLIRLNVKGLPPGEHAFHIHERGECDAGKGFESAGGHQARAGEPHGYLGAPPGRHAGDMPNQFVAADGSLRAEVFNTEVALDPTSLLDGDGAALVIHERPDDYRSQPAGGAGARIACAVIIRDWTRKAGAGAPVLMPARRSTLQASSGRSRAP